MAENFALNLTLNLKDFRARIGDVRSGLTSLTNTGVQNLQGVFAGAAAGLNVMANAVHVARGAIDGLRAGFGFLTQFSEQGAALEEGASKFEAVFKQMTVSANAFAVALSAEVGRSVIEVKAALADTQGVLSGFGFDRAKASEISQTLVKLGIDLASFNNTSDNDAFGALRSGLLGEAEALKKFGVAITEATVQQQAFQLGFDPNNLTEQEKVLTRLAVITASTADAQGDAARTSDSFANQVKRLQGGLADLAGTLGAGINDALKPLLSQLTGFLTSNKKGIETAVASIVDGLKSGVAAALPFVEQAGKAIVAVFNDLPATFASVQAALGRFGDFTNSIFNILTGNSGATGSAFGELGKTSTSIFANIEAALTAPGIIKALGYIRIAVALLGGGFGELLQVGQLALSGLLIGIAAIATPLNFIFQVLGKISPAFQGAADDIDAFVAGAADKAVELAESAQKKMVEIAGATAKEIASATFDVQNADQIAKQLRAQSAARRENVKAEKETSAAAQGTVSAETQKVAAGEKSAATFKQQKEAQEAVKKATEETAKIEGQLKDARVKATETLRDDIALMRERIAAEIKLSKSAAEASEIRKKGLLQETALVEEAQRKQAEATKKRIEEDKKSARSLNDFLAGQNRAGRRAKGLGAGADIEEAGDPFRSQFENIRSTGDAEKLKASVKDAFKRALDVPQKAFEEAARAVAETRAQLAAARSNGDFDAVVDLTATLTEQQKTMSEAQTSLNDASKRRIESESKMLDEISVAAKEQVEKQAKAKAQADEIAQLAADSKAGGAGATDEAAATAGPDQTPATAALETLKGVLDGANTALRDGLQGLTNGLGNLVTAAQEILNASTTLFPQALASLDSVLASQQQYGVNLQDFGTSMVFKLTELAGEIGTQGRTLGELAVEVRGIKAQATGSVDARTAGL